MTDPTTQLYAGIARAYLKSKKVHRYRLKKISDMDDRQVIQACHWWYTENGLVEDYREFEAPCLAKYREENLPCE